MGDATVELVEAENPWPHIERGVGRIREWGLQRGDRLLVLQGGHLPTFGLLAAASLEGIVAVPLPPDMGGDELTTTVLDADPHVIAVDRQLTRSADVLKQLDYRIVEVGHDDLMSGSRVEASCTWPQTRPMSYTSGTTGRRKGVFAGVHGPEWGQELIADEVAGFGDRHGDRHLVISPLYHSGPFRFALVTALTGGQIAVLPRFSGHAFRAALREIRPSSVMAVPTHLHRLLEVPDLSPDDLASLTLLGHGGAPCSEPLKRRVIELAPAGAVWEIYGSTEGQFTACPPDVWAANPGTVGPSRSGRRLSIRGTDGEELGPGAVGEVWVHVPDFARFTYWRDPERTEAAWDGDAFTVGDLGHLDDEGLLYLDGRPGDLVISGGVNVYPAEVEKVLLEAEGVAEAIVFGVPDPDWGERLVAAVIPWPGAALDTEVLRDLVAQRHVRARVPKEILVVDDLPRTAIGKVRRVGLAAALGFEGADDAG